MAIKSLAIFATLKEKYIVSRGPQEVRIPPRHPTLGWPRGGEHDMPRRKPAKKAKKARSPRKPKKKPVVEFDDEEESLPTEEE